MIKLVGLAAMMAIALATTAVPTLAQGDRAAERAATQAQDVVHDLDQALKDAQKAERDANQTAVQPKETAEGKGESTQEVTEGTLPASGGISTGNIVPLFLGGSVLVIATWLFARRATR